MAVSSEAVPCEGRIQRRNRGPRSLPGVPASLPKDISTTSAETSTWSAPSPSEKLPVAVARIVRVEKGLVSLAVRLKGDWSWRSPRPWKTAMVRVSPPPTGLDSTPRSAMPSDGYSATRLRPTKIDSMVASSPMICGASGNWPKRP